MKRVFGTEPRPFPGGVIKAKEFSRSLDSKFQQFCI
jgi:hypothetical protein